MSWLPNQQSNHSLALCAMLMLPALAWPRCEPPFAHTARADWCAGFAGNPDADFQTRGRSNEIFMAERSFSGNLVRQGKSHRFLLGLDYAYRNYDADEEFGANLDLHTVTVEPQWLLQGEQRDWLLRLGVSRAVSSNLVTELDIDSDELIASAAITARKSHEKGIFVTGLAYDQRFGNPKFYPLLGMEMPIGRDWQLGLIVPAPYLHWKGNERWSGTIELQPAGGRWRVLDDADGRSFYTRIREIRLSASLRRKLARRWHIEGTLGASFNRNLASTAGDGSRINVSLDDALYGALAVIYQPALPR